jgi:hypothetical protein
MLIGARRPVHLRQFVVIRKKGLQIQIFLGTKDDKVLYFYKNIS